MPFKIDGRECQTVEEMFKEFEKELTWFEKYIEIPFYVHFWNHIKEFYYNLLHFPSNIRKWARFVWNDRDWNSQYNLEAFEIKCRSQAKHFDDGSEEGAKISKEALECAEALKRIREDDYIDFSIPLTESYTPEMVLALYEEKRMTDIEIVKNAFIVMNKWWD